MEQVKLLRRRTGDLLASAQQNMASTQQSFLSSAQQNLPAFSMPQFNLRTLTQSSSSPPAEPTATWQRIDDIPALRRSGHSLDIVGGSAYIFGGELDPTSPDGRPELADNDMHVVRLPVSGASTDYLRIRAVPETPDEVGDEAASSAAGSEVGSVSSPSRSKGKGRAIEISRPDLGDVPAPRAGHATAVIGSRIFLFGGHGLGPNPDDDTTTTLPPPPLDEAGTVWVFDTRTRAWSRLDPSPAVKGGAITIHPAARTGHCAAATDKPRDFGPTTTVTSSSSSSNTTTTAAASSTPTPAAAPASPTTLRARAQSWRDWAVGDLLATAVGAQEPAVGHVAENAVDEESRGYGTLLIHAGRLSTNGSTRGGDVWAFDVRSRMWSELPAAPAPARDAAALCVGQNRLFRFGGIDDDEAALGGQLDYLPLEVETADDRRRRGGARVEVAVRARDAWQTIVQRPTSTYSSTVTPATPLSSPRASTFSESLGSEQQQQQDWPCPRGGAVLEAVGREAVVLAFGESAGGQPLDDVWVFRAPPAPLLSVMQVVGRRNATAAASAEGGRWTRVATRPHDEDEEEEGNRPAGALLLPRARGLLAAASMNNLEDSGLLVWGGRGEAGARLGDGWVLRL
ncbi:Kelch repeat type 1 [Cordyceps fumosorosea ARSEF 2679]|uniref:Kelch repeat type 1 n=1 Tax=Cordyceps fumosorosea (strain ARSEF 2679) TaxID=1081104 RepID=A0A167VUT0_CORFA|nr:Kelch repeat type 1 [Cordyceps fumosorosea ARSEF 2679]OAA63001.1 Kelch repeat type 1 [Cordyceps fumosorosea ARSEF 2679]